MTAPKVVKLDENFWQVTLGERWYTAHLDRSKRTISGQVFITSDIGRTVDYWGPTGQRVVNALRDLGIWS